MMAWQNGEDSQVMSAVGYLWLDRASNVVLSAEQAGILPCGRLT